MEQLEEPAKQSPPPRVQSYTVTHKGDVLSYPGDGFRVDVIPGALVIYERRPHYLFDGDEDLLLTAYGDGQWTLAVFYEPS